MDPYNLRSHLEQVHGAEDVDDLTSLDANRLHHKLHVATPTAHPHDWDGHIAEPQGPIAPR